MRYIFLSILILITYVNITYITNAKVDIPYPLSEIEPGQFISDTEQLFTYETLCSGYYIKDTSNKNKIKYIGYGDLSDKYTYEQAIDIGIISSTTDSTF